MVIISRATGHIPWVVITLGTKVGRVRVLYAERRQGFSYVKPRSCRGQGIKRHSRSNHFADLWGARYGNLTDGLEFGKIST